MKLHEDLKTQKRKSEKVIGDRVRFCQLLRGITSTRDVILTGV